MLFYISQLITQIVAKKSFFFLLLTVMNILSEYLIGYEKYILRARVQKSKEWPKSHEIYHPRGEGEIVNFFFRLK